MIFLLELLEPAAAVHFHVAVAATNRCGEEASLVSNDAVVQRQPLALMVPCPIRQCSFDVWKFTFGSLDGRSATVIRKEVLVLLAKDFRDGTTSDVSSGLYILTRNPRSLVTFSLLQT